MFSPQLSPTQAKLRTAHLERRARLSRHAWRSTELDIKPRHVFSRRPVWSLPIIEDITPVINSLCTTVIIPLWSAFGQPPTEPHTPREITVDAIIAATSLHFDVSVMDLMSIRRTARVVLPRQIAMYLARTLTILSMPKIGVHFGGRDHTTVLHNCRKVSGLASDPQVAADIAAITELLTNQPSGGRQG